MFAFIQNGVVHQLFTTRPVVHRDIVIIECPSDTQEGWIYQDGAFSAPAAIAPSKAALKAHVSAKWSFVINDGTVTVGGFTSQTDGVSANLLYGAIVYAQNDPSAVILWDGVTPITKAQLIELGIGVAGYVQATFNVAGDLKAQIDSEAVTTFAQIDSAAWPASS